MPGNILDKTRHIPTLLRATLLALRCEMEPVIIPAVSQVSVTGFGVTRHAQSIRSHTFDIMWFPTIVIGACSAASHCADDRALSGCYKPYLEPK